MSYLKCSFAAVALCTAALLPSTHSSAATFYGSFSTNEPSAGSGYDEEDIFEIDGSSDSLYLATAPFFNAGEDIDALYVADNGDVYFSTTGAATIGDGVDGGGGGIDSGDIIRYSPTAASGSQFTTYIPDAGPNVDAFWIEGGVPYLSLSVDDTVGTNTVSVLDDQVFTLTGALDLDTGTVSVVFDSNDYLLEVGEDPATSTDVDAFGIVDGKYVFSTSSSNSFLVPGGDPQEPTDYVSRDGGVVYLFDPADPGSFDPLSASSIYYDGSSELGTSVNIDAIHPVAIPEPSTFLLVASALGLLAVRRR